MLKRRVRPMSAADWPRPDDISPLTHRLLRLRGVESEAQARAYLHPGPDQLNDPFLLSDMGRAVQVIQSAVAAKKRICVYGDYDVDGVCACAILVSYLKSVGADAEPYLPSRHSEGYGLNEAAVRKIAETHGLIVTVDCGITAVELADLAAKIGMDVVITDHHRPEGQLPRCPVVNPLLNGYPFPYLCGTGVAFQLVSALGGREAGMEYIDYAALATIADIVPLQAENRAIAYIGLKKINASPRPGIRALIDAAALGAKPLTAGNVAFQLTPRLNASGRLGDAMRAYRLLVETDMQTCIDLAIELNEENQKRRELEQQAIDQAEEILKSFDFPAHRAIVVAGESWNPGVIGLAASRLTEKYHYPTVVLTRDGDILTGSCRSIEGVDIHDALTYASDALIQFGGHSMAAGLRLKPENLARFAALLDEYLFRNIPAETWIPFAEYDALVTPGALTPETVESLEAFSPTGCGNPAPVFLMACEVASARPVGAGGAHLKLTLRADGETMDGIWFRRGDAAAGLPKEADALFSASLNRFQGQVSVQAEMRALEPRSARTRLSDAAAKAGALFQAFLTDHVYNDFLTAAKPISVSGLQSLLRESAQGVLIVSAGVDAARRLAEQLGDDAPIEALIGAYPSDPRCFHALCVCPTGTPPAGYRRIVNLDLPDGVINATDRLEGEGIFPSFRRLPDVAALRRVYQAARQMTRRPYYFSGIQAVFKTLAEDADVDPVAAVAGLRVLEHMNLVQADVQPGNVKILIPEMVRKSPEDDELYQKLTRWRNHAAKGGA